MNPLLGVFFHWLGGLASASFYVPYKGIRDWSWEVFWLAGGAFSWMIAPWCVAWLRTENLLTVLANTPPQTLGLCYLFGFLWGFGGLTYGLAVRYLGIGLGTAMALGFTAAFGTLIPPLVSGELLGTLIHSIHGVTVLIGIAVCLAGIAVVGLAGHKKEKEVLHELDRIKEANFARGAAVAVFAGIMSSCFAYGLAAGKPIAELSLAQGTDVLARGLPILIVVLMGGFTTNVLWCIYLILKNRSGGQFVNRNNPHAPLLRNYLLCAFGGSVWYFQFFFYTMGESQMGEYGFSSWTLHMASIIIFATLWGVILREWKGVSARTKWTLAAGVAVLVGGTVIIGFGNYMGVNDEV